MPGEREALRATFDEDAALYDRARPTYPAALFDAVDHRLAGGAAVTRVLEIGCGTGQATRPLAERGHHVVAVDLGAAMARTARANLARFPHVDVVHADVERWAPPGRPFDLAVSATAFHWLDPATRFARVAGLLKPGGLLALVQTLHVAGPSDAFFADAQRCYERWDPDTPADIRLPRLHDLPDADHYGVEHARAFRDVEVRRFAVDHRYDAEQYLDLLRTFSNHRALPLERREGLLACLRRRIAAEPDGTVVKSVAFELCTARRR